MTAAATLPETPARAPAESSWAIRSDRFVYSPMPPGTPAVAYADGLRLFFARGPGTDMRAEAVRHARIRADLNERDRDEARARMAAATDRLRLQHALAEVEQRAPVVRLADARAKEAKARAETLDADPAATPADRSAAHEAAGQSAREAKEALAKLANAEAHLAQSRAAVRREAERVAVEVYRASEAARHAEVKRLLRDLAATAAPILDQLHTLLIELAAGQREPAAVNAAAEWVAALAGTPNR